MRLSAHMPSRQRTLFVGLILAACLLRVLYALNVELMPEEAYYWNYSRHLDIGYLDHPPMLAWLIRVGTTMFGQTPFGVRFGALLCGLVTALFVHRLTFNLYDEATALAAVLLAQLLPFFFLAGLLATPDAPLTAAWAASLYFLERALVARHGRAWWGVGISVGLGLISKYSIGLLGVVTAAFMMRDAASRQWWRRGEPYAAVGVALIIFSPVIIWNAQHEWASFAFQTSRRLADRPQFALHKLLAGALVLLTPTGLTAVVLALAERDSTDMSRARRLLVMAIAIPLTVFALFSLRHEVKLDWTGATWTAALPLLAVGLLAHPQNRTGVRRALRSAWLPTLSAMVLILAAGWCYLVVGLPGVGYGRHIELLPIGWQDLSDQVRTIADTHRRERGTELLLVGMDRYAIASELAFYGTVAARGTVETSSDHLFGGVGLMYERWTPAAAQVHKDLLLIALDRRDLTAAEIAAHAVRLGPIESGNLSRNGSLITPYYYRLAFDYR